MTGHTPPVPNPADEILDDDDGPFQEQDYERDDDAGEELPSEGAGDAEELPGETDEARQQTG